MYIDFQAKRENGKHICQFRTSEEKEPMQKRSDRIEYLHPDGEPHEGLVDLSATGMAVFRSKPMIPDAVIQVQIESLTLKAKIVYSQEKVGGFKVGLHFLEVSAPDRASLTGLVEKFSRGSTLRIMLDA